MSGTRASRYQAFTLVEVMIVVVLFAILAVILVPKLLSARVEAKESALVTDLQTIRRQVELYKFEHGGRGPHLSDSALSFTKIAERMTGRTDSSGKLDPSGRYGPYLDEWPPNPFCPEKIARDIRWGPAAAPPRNGLSGWYYCTTTCVVSANSITGGESLDPE